MAAAPARGRRAASRCRRTAARAASCCSRTCPRAERQRLLELLPLERFTERTITDRAVLESELDRIVSVGYAVDNEEYVLGVACVAVPVRNRHGDVIASLAVQGATARLPLMRAIEFVPRLRAAAAEIGSTFG